MKAVILNCFDTYENRTDLVRKFLIKKGYDVIVIQSDFRHIEKRTRKEQKQDYVFIDTLPYYKNLSLKRLISHYNFSEKAFIKVEIIKPDLLYTILPPNSLAKFAAQYKINNPHVELVYDIQDLWPETIPLGKVKRLKPFTIWSRIRNDKLKYADLVITECNLYRSILFEYIEDVRSKTVYLAKSNIEVLSKLQLSEKEIHLAYLGSINNIIDIVKIKQIILSIQNIKPVTIHIIGDGEKKEKFIKEIKMTGAKVIYYGKVYDTQRKQEIFDKCHFGLNIMKDNVRVGLTMKSIDYFQHGVPIINNIPADTKELVKKYKVGINIEKELTPQQAKEIAKKKLIDYKKMRQDSLSLFNNQFTEKAFFEKMDDK